uniref:Uncharacterized protein n=1 Tax=Magallana gigas TaxID=29159 RepID=A0A8W8MML4_MAGGI
MTFTSRASTLLSPPILQIRELISQMIAKELGVILSFMVVATLAKNIYLAPLAILPSTTVHLSQAPVPPLVFPGQVEPTSSTCITCIAPSLPGLNAGSSFPGGSTFPGTSSGSTFSSRSPFGSNQMISLSGSSSFSGLSNTPSFGDFDSDSYYTPDLDSEYGSSLPGYDSSPSYSEYNPYLIDIPTYNYSFMNKLFLK